MVIGIQILASQQKVSLQRGEFRGKWGQWKRKEIDLKETEGKIKNQGYVRAEGRGQGDQGNLKGDTVICLLTPTSSYPVEGCRAISTTVNTGAPTHSLPSTNSGSEDNLTLFLVRITYLLCDSR